MRWSDDAWRYHAEIGEITMRNGCGPIRLTVGRLGQFTAIEADAAPGFMDALDALAREWKDLDETQRIERAEEVARLRDPDAYAADEADMTDLQKLLMMQRRHDAAMAVFTSIAGREQQAAEPAPAPAPETVPEPAPAADLIQNARVCSDCGQENAMARTECTNCGKTLAVTADASTDDAGDDTWHSILFVEGVTTNDGRAAAPGAMNTRPLPLPLMFITQKSAMGGHDGAMLGGSIETITRDNDLANQLAEGGFISLENGASLLVATGTYAQTDDGQALRGLINRQELRFISADTEIIDAEEVWPLSEDGSDGAPFLRVTRGNIMGGTACPFPAFQQCIIGPASMSLFDLATQGMPDVPIESGATPAPPTPVAVAASGGPQTPPGSWFENPRFGANDRDDPRLIEDPAYPNKFMCPQTITDDGRIFGHAAAWHRKHIAFNGQAVYAPRSATDYANFCTGTILVATANGEDVVRCGVITMNTGHASTDPRTTAAAAKRHYDDTGTQIAHIEVGEDQHGIWYAGALVANANEDDLRAFRSGGVSGDWRPMGTSTEMCALLAVNVPGFPIPRPRRSYRVIGEGDDAVEQELALVAAGFVPPRDPMHDYVNARIAEALRPVREQLAALAPLLLADLDAQAARRDGSVSS